MKRLLLVIVVAVAAYFGLAREGNLPRNDTVDTGTRTGDVTRNESARISSQSGQTLASAFENHASDFQVEGGGVVTRILPDDDDGSRHQRFIIELDSGQTLLMSHNIDLAPRIAGVREGDKISFYGEYEWNPQGGVIHWTHRDPDGQHPAGWIEHNGRTYQ